MFRSVILLSLATLSLFASCVDLRLPSKVSQCEQNNSCTDGTGGATGGMGGSTARSGGSTGRSADAGISDVPSGGRGGSAGTSTGGTSGGASGGGTTAGGTGGTGSEATGGSSSSPDAGADLNPDTAIDKPVVNPDVPLDTETKPDTLDTNKPGPEVGPEPGPEVSPDLPPDLLPDRPDTAIDGPTCIQNFKSNGYALTSPTDGGVKACSECKDSNGTSLETACKNMIDCLVPVWVCKPGSSGCWITCRNNTGGDMVLDTCVTGLVNRACF